MKILFFIFVFTFPNINNFKILKRRKNNISTQLQLKLEKVNSFLLEKKYKNKIKKQRKRKLIGIPGGGVPGMGGGTEFPPLPKPDNMPVIINSPPVKLPQEYKKGDDVGHIIFTPTLVYPRKKKRIIVHHNSSMMDYYKQMTNSLNPYYAEMAQQNPYYSEAISRSPGFQKFISHPSIIPGMLKVSQNLT